MIGIIVLEMLSGNRNILESRYLVVHLMLCHLPPSTYSVGLYVCVLTYHIDELSVSQMIVINFN